MKRKHNPRMRKRTIERLCIHEALVLRVEQVYDGRDYYEKCVHVAKCPARFYTMTRSETSSSSMSRLTPTNGGKQDYTPPFKVILPVFDLKPKDRIIPIVDGDIWKYSELLYESNTPPIDPAFMQMMCEVPVELSLLTYKIYYDGIEYNELTAEQKKVALADHENMVIEWEGEAVDI